MEKQLKDYLHLYLGCQVLINDMGEDVLCTLVTMSCSGGCFASGTTKNGKLFNYHGGADSLKPILRKLSSMTEEEAWTAWKKGGEHSRHNGVCNYVSAFKNPGTDLGMNIFDWSATINYMRSVGIDCDKLIESGLAIDSATLNH